MIRTDLARNRMQKLRCVPAVLGLKLGDRCVDVVVDSRWGDAEYPSDFFRTHPLPGARQAFILPDAELGNASASFCRGGRFLITRAGVHGEILDVSS